MVIFAYGAIAALAGVASGILSKSIISIILGFTFFPLGAIIVNFIVAGFFYYTFFFFFNRELPFLKLYTGLFMCSLPSLFCQVVSQIISPIAIIGILASFFLMIVCFVENFQIPRKPLSKLLAILFFLYCVIWILQTIQFTEKEEQLHKIITPESLDILERDLKGK